MSDLDSLAKMVTHIAALEAIVANYACHVHWRCEHQDRWPWGDGDCLCGLVEAVRKAGLDPDLAINAPVARG